MRSERIVPVLLACALTLACGGSSNGSQVQGGNGGPTSGGGSGLDLGNGTGGTDFSNGVPDAGVITPGAACAQSASRANLSSLTMLVMMDDSGSMRMNNKWNQAAAAMKAFFADPAAAGLRVGLRLFPSDEPTVGCSQSVCDMDQAAATTACSTALVDIGQLTAAAAPADTQEAKLLAAIPAAPQRGNGGGTPTYAALQGAENIAVAYAAAHPTEKVVVVFVTDGQPNGCDADIGHIAAIASDTLAAHKINTYAIGILGSNQQTMDQIAVAGGTTAGIMIGGASGATTEQDLLTAFGNIKASNVSCDFAVPPAPASLMLSFDDVNVNFTPGSGAASTLRRVENASTCGTAGGWYYDSNLVPTQIHLCANTCTTVQADSGAALQVLFSCVPSQGYVPPPR